MAIRTSTHKIKWKCNRFERTITILCIVWIDRTGTILSPLRVQSTCKKKAEKNKKTIVNVCEVDAKESNSFQLTPSGAQRNHRENSSKSHLKQFHKINSPNENLRNIPSADLASRLSLPFTSLPLVWPSISMPVSPQPPIPKPLRQGKKLSTFSLSSGNYSRSSLNIIGIPATRKILRPS